MTLIPADFILNIESFFDEKFYKKYCDNNFRVVGSGSNWGGVVISQSFDATRGRSGIGFNQFNGKTGAEFIAFAAKYCYFRDV